MKKSLILPALLLLGVMTGFADNKHSFSVSGAFPESYKPYLPSDSIIHIIEWTTGDTLAATKVQTDGSFMFRGTYDGTPRYAYILDGISIPFILEEGNVKVGTHPFSCSGTPLNDEAMRIYRKLRKASDETIRPNYPELNDTTTSEAVYSRVYKQFKVAQDSLYVSMLKEEFAGDYADGPVNAYVIDRIIFMARTYESHTAFWNLAGNLFRSIPKQMKLRRSFENEHIHGAGTMFVDCIIPQGNLDGTDARFSDFIGKGKYILVDFWASWCGPCRKELPNVKAVYDDYKGDQFDCLSVACWDKPEATKKAIEEEQLVWPQIINTQKIATDAYGISGIPQIILFAPDGTIVERNLRGEHLRQVVEKALKK